MSTHQTRKVSTAIISVIGLIALGLNAAPAHSIVLQDMSIAYQGTLNGNFASMTKLYVNHKPRAKIAKTSTTAGSGAVTFSLASKIFDVDGDSLGITLGRVKHRSASTAGDVVTVTPPRSWDGKFSIPYTVRDGKGGIARSVIAVTVKPKPTSKPIDDPGRFCLNAGC